MLGANSDVAPAWHKPSAWRNATKRAEYEKLLHIDYFIYSFSFFQTRLWAGESGVRILQESRGFCLLQSVKTSSAAYPAAYSMGTGALFRWKKRPGHEVNYSSPCSADVKNEWSHTSTFPVWLYGVDYYSYASHSFTHHRHYIISENHLIWHIHNFKHFLPALWQCNSVLSFRFFTINADKKCTRLAPPVKSVAASAPFPALSHTSLESCLESRVKKEQRNGQPCFAAIQNPMVRRTNEW